MKTISFVISLFVSVSASACDLCGCANGGAYFGILPQVGRSFVGLRYRTSSYESHLNSRLLRTREVFHTTELWGRFYPAKRVQVLAFVPVQFNRQTQLSDGSVRRERGLGDATVLANYNLFNTFWDTTRTHRVNHSLLLGGGLKLPTGRFRYDPANDAQVANENFQLGTGSVDGLLSLLYSIRAGHWGLNTDVTARLNTTNAQQYRFGHRLTANSLLFYVHETKGATFMPNVGLYVETAARDHRHGTPNDQTGGYVTMANAGLEVYLTRFSVGATGQVPLTQNVADHQVRANARATVHVTVMF